MVAMGCDAVEMGCDVIEMGCDAVEMECDMVEMGWGTRIRIARGMAIWYNNCVSRADCFSLCWLGVWGNA